MPIKLHTLSHKPLKWNNELPPSFKGVRLPGGTVFSAVGDFGSICIQEFKAKDFSIRFNVFDLVQKFVFKIQSKQFGLHTRILLKGGITHEIKTIGKWSLKKNQFSLLYAKSPQITVLHEKDLHISFETFYSGRILRDYFSYFPSLTDLIKENPSLWAKTHWADMETMELVHSILRCRYEEPWRRYFFESRIRDLLFKYLIQTTRSVSTDVDASEKEMEAIYAAEEMIVADLSKHIRIPQLSKKVLLNEFRLKSLFKKIFGMGPYEYLVHKRLLRSKELLESGLSVKTVSHMMGYRSSHFIMAFRNEFGFPPGAVKKRNS